MSLSTAKPSCPETQLIGSDEFACWVVSWPQHALSRRSLSRAENECRLSEDLDPKPRTGRVWSCRGRGCSDQAAARVFGKFGNSSFREHASFVSSWYSLWRFFVGRSTPFVGMPAKLSRIGRPSDRRQCSRQCFWCWRFFPAMPMHRPIGGRR